MQKPELVFTQCVLEIYSQLLSEVGANRMILLCDSNTKKLCQPLLGKGPFRTIEIPAGEVYKNLETAVFIMDELLRFKADRNTVLVNLGGGVVTDIGGFVASVYCRGIKFVNIPTTLLAMVDAAIGGKTGVDHLHLKNFIGTFTHPYKIIISTEFLETLDKEENNSAWAEIVKTASVCDADLFQMIRNNAPIETIIQKCALTKQALTEADFHDSNTRQLLNFGHTFGHAYESFCLESGTPVRHGIAVARGMIAEIAVALHLGLIRKKDADIIRETIQDYLPAEPFTESEFEGLFRFLKSDKKNSDGKITFSLPVSVGTGRYGIQATAGELKNWKNQGYI